MPRGPGRGTIARLVSVAVAALTSRSVRARSAERSQPRPPASEGAAGTHATRAVTPPRSLTLAYEPHPDGDPDAGEIVWTWVPYDENDGRGKDRPVLVIARHEGARVLAVRLTSRPRDGDRDYVAIGAGACDASGRESWVDIDGVYSVHPDGMRREASALDRARYADVARALGEKYGWRFAG